MMALDKRYHFAAHLVRTFPPIREALFKGSPSDTEILSAVALVKNRIDEYWMAWQRHPNFERDMSITPLPSWNPVVVGVFSHPPGFDDMVESYTITSLQDLIGPSSMAGSQKLLGRFQCIRPIISDFPTDPYRRLAVSFSLNAQSSVAYHSRQMLRQMLPKKLGKFVSKARWYKSKPKYWLVPALTPQMWTAYRKKQIAYRDLPEEYRTKKKPELFAMWMKRNHSRDAKHLEKYIDLEDFFRVATGEVHPRDVRSFIAHQIPLWPDNNF